MLSWAEQTTNVIINLFSNNAFHPWFLRMFYNIPIMSHTLSFIKGNLILFLSQMKSSSPEVVSELIFKKIEYRYIVGTNSDRISNFCSFYN